MHSLVGTFIKTEKEEQLDGKMTLYPFKLIFPPNKVRSYYLLSRDDRFKWVQHIKDAIGYSSVEDFYTL
jgi:hypothetical protein